MISKPAKIAKIVKKFIRSITASYTVYAFYFDPMSGKVKEAKHLASDWDRALEWMAMYDVDDIVTVHERWLGFTAPVPCASRSMDSWLYRLAW